MSAAILLDCLRVRAHQRTRAAIAVNYRDDGDSLPELVILSNWQPRKGTYRDRHEYRVEEIPSDGGRGFMLHRDPFVVANEGPDADDYYGVFLAHNGQDHICSCRGFAAHSRCKHFDAVRGLIEGGHIDEPCADRKPELVVTEAPW